VCAGGVLWGFIYPFVVVSQRQARLTPPSPLGSSFSSLSFYTSLRLNVQLGKNHKRSSGPTGKSLAFRRRADGGEL
jgi:hypothetical protein